MPEKTSTTTVIVGLILLAILILTGMTYMNCKQDDSSKVERLTNVNSSEDNSSMDSTQTSDSVSQSSAPSSVVSSDASSESAASSVSQPEQDIVIRRGKNANNSATYKNMSYAEMIAVVLVILTVILWMAMSMKLLVPIILVH